MTRVSVQVFETAGNTSQLWVRDSNNNSGGAYSAITDVITAGGAVTAAIRGIAAGTQTATSATVVFSNSNGITFGMSGSTRITASHDGLTSQNGQAVSADNGSVSFQTVSFSNANGVSFSTAAGPAIVASHNGLTSQSNQAFSAQGGSSAFQTLSFNNANGATFSNNGGAVELSYSVPSTAGLLSNIRVSAGTTSNLLSAVTFNDANGVTFGLNASTITASHNGLTSQSNQAVSAGNGSVAFQTVSFSNANGVSFSTAAGPAIVASVATSLTNINVSAGTTSNNLSALTFGDAGGVSFGLNGSVITASAPAGGGGLTNIRVSAGTTSNLLSAVTFANGNGISFGLDASTVTASHNGITSQSRQIITGEAVGNTTNQSTGTIDVSAMGFEGAGIVSVGFSGAANPRVLISATQSNQAASGSNGSFTFQTLSFSNGNGISFGSSGGGAITASHNAITSQSNQAITFFATGNTTQNSSTVLTANSILLRGTGDASVGYSNGSIVFSVAAAGGGTALTAYATGNTTQSTTGTIALSSLIFRGEGGASLGVSNGSIVVSGAAGGAGGTISAYAVGQSTLNSTATFANSVEFGASGNVMKVFATNNSVVYSFNRNDVVGSVSQWPMEPRGIATSSAASVTTGATGGSTQVTFASMYVRPLILPIDLSCNRIQAMMSLASSAGTGSVTFGQQIGLYTRNGGTALSLLSVWNFVCEVSQNSVTAQTFRWYFGTNSTSNSSSLAGNVSATFTGMRRCLMATNIPAITQGHYFVVENIWRRSSGLDPWRQSGVRLTDSQFTWAHQFGSNTTGPPLGEINGVFSTTTNVSAFAQTMMPVSINETAVSQTGGSSRNQWPMVIFGRG